nr:TA system VapC family ribonuclease toxin [Mycobacterium kansasii]
MRTTLTPDEDVVRLIEKAVHRERRPMKHVINDALRSALAQPMERRTPYQLKPHRTAVRPTYPAIFGFLRIATNARILTEPLSAAEAVAYVRDWLTQPNVDLLIPSARHLDLASGLLEELGTAANLTTDVQLAAYAIEHNTEMQSNDPDFARFAGPTWTDPLRDRKPARYSDIWNSTIAATASTASSSAASRAAADGADSTA